MFAKRAKASNPEQRPDDDASQTVQSGSHKRDIRVQELERQIEEERANTARVQSALDAVTFQKEILEKSYAKQLAEVRDKRAAAEAELQEKNEILANLDGGHEHALRELNDALTVIKVLKNERDKLRQQIAQGGFRQPGERRTRAEVLLGEPIGHLSRAKSADVGGDTSGETINKLIANTSWGEKKPEVASGHTGAQVAKPEETPQEEMIAPDLVFTEKDKDDGR